MIRRLARDVTIAVTVTACLIILISIAAATVQTARAQFAESLPPHSITAAAPEGPIHYDGPRATVGGPIGVASVVMPGRTNSGVIDISPAFADWLQPYVQSVTNALIALAFGYVVNWMRTHWKINLDDKQRAAMIAALQNQAGSLIADGKVKISGGKIDVHNEALAAAANDLMKSVPGAAAHFAVTPDYVAARIVDTIPQIAAGAAMLAQHAAAEIKPTGITINGTPGTPLP